MKLTLSRRLKVGLGNLLSPFVPIDANRIALVTKKSVPFGGNIRCIADELLGDGKHEVIIYSEGKLPAETRKAMEAKGAMVLTGFSLTNLRILLSCGTVFVGHSVRDAHIGSARPGRQVINLWHGVPIKRIELLMEEKLSRSDPGKLELMRANARLYDHVIASNENDAKIMSNAFGVPLENVLVSGLPRFDYMQDGYPLPSDLADQEEKLRSEIGDRRMILYSPTFREKSKSPFHALTDDVAKEISRFCEKNRCVFAIRPHPYDQKSARRLFSRSNLHFIDASSKRFPETAIVLRAADALITDYSSIWVDYLLRDRPILGMIPDFDRYNSAERGFIYEFDEIFPGPINQDWSGTTKALGEALEADNSGSIQFGETSKHHLARQLLLPPASEYPGSYSRKMIVMLQK